jgi:hypothetical protein
VEGHGRIKMCKEVNRFQEIRWGNGDTAHTEALKRFLAPHFDRLIADYEDRMKKRDEVERVQEAQNHDAIKDAIDKLR